MRRQLGAYVLHEREVGRQPPLGTHCRPECCSNHQGCERDSVGCSARHRRRPRQELARLRRSPQPNASARRPGDLRSLPCSTQVGKLTLPKTPPLRRRSRPALWNNRHNYSGTWRRFTRSVRPRTSRTGRSTSSRSTRHPRRRNRPYLWNRFRDGRGPLLTNGPLITRVPVLGSHAAAHSNLARAAVSLAKLDADAVGDTGTDSLRPA